MVIINDVTINYSIPMPSFGNNVVDDFPRLRTSFENIDGILFSKADKSNTYTKSEVESIAATILTATSTYSVAIGTGLKTFATQANKQFSVGQFVVVSSSANPANFMFGQVTSYSATTLVVNVVVANGSGTLASWNISISGIQGLQGATGAQGIQGVQGVAGVQGIQGVAGANGATWLSGSGVPAAGTGANNDYYFRTDTSDIYKKTAGAWGSPIANIKGATGATGAQGIQGIQGVMGAAGATGAAGINGATWLSGTSPVGGVDGDYYFKTDTCDIYKKVSGSWGSPIANIKGADGTGGGGSSTYTLQNKTAAYTVVAGDLGTIINCTANSFTVSLTSAATLGAGFHCSIWNSSNTSTHVITIDPAGTEAIDGITTLVLSRGEGFDIVSDGMNWLINNKKPMRGYAENFVNTLSRPVSAGNGSVAIGNSYAGTQDSFAVQIRNNTVSYGSIANGSIAMGYLAKANGGNSVAMGSLSYAFAANSFAIGTGATATVDGSFALGNYSKSMRFGAFSYASGKFSNVGDAQSGVLVLYGTSTNSAADVLTSNGMGGLNATVLNQLTVESSQAIAINGTMIAKQQGSNNIAAFRRL